MSDTPAQPANPAANSARVDDQLAKIKQEYIARLPGKVKNAQQLWEKLSVYNWSDDGFKLFYNFIHTFAGNGKTFGYDKLGDTAKQLCKILSGYLEQKDIPNAQVMLQISELVGALGDSIERDDEAGASEDSLKSVELTMSKNLSRHTYQVFVVDDDVAVADFISAQISSTGYQVETFYDVDDAIAKLTATVPDALIMDLSFPGDRFMGIKASGEINEIAGKRIPTIFVSARSDLTARLAAVRAHGFAYLTKPIKSETLVDKLDEMVLQNNIKGKVMIIDDDKNLADMHALQLNQDNYKVKVITKPLAAYEALLKYKPDVILLDVHMPDINGLELARLIRQDSTLLSTPIIFISADSDEEVHHDAVSISGDVFMQKPLNKDDLVTMVGNRLINSKLIRAKINEVSQTDPQSGLVNRKFFLGQLEKYLSSYTESKRKTYLVGLSVDHIQHVIDQIGMGLLEHFDDFVSSIVLKATQNSLSFSYLTDNVLCAMVEDKSIDELMEACEILNKVVQANPYEYNDSKINLTSSIGIVELNEYSNTVNQSLLHLQHAILQADAQGGNQTCFYEVESKEASSASISISVVEQINAAIDNKSYCLFFQPIVGFANTKEHYYEVLVRLVSETGRMFVPAQFFPQLAQRNLMHELDRWVIEHTLDIFKQNKDFKNHGNFFIKLNGESLGKGSFGIWLNNCINSSMIIGERRIIFEVAESEVVTRMQEVKKFISMIEYPTCMFAIDHFGTTSKSMSLLDALRVDHVKITGEMVNAIQHDTDKRRELKQLIEQVHAKNVDVIVGSMEDPQTLAMMWSWGVRHFQGYFIRNPQETMDFDFTNSDTQLGTD